MDQEVLRKLQLTELDILLAVDKFCNDNNINYSLFGGTALGAVRHDGFIPWDDDIDICMCRNDYEKFLRLWKKSNISGYFLQGTNPDDKTTQTHSKVRKDKTVLATREEYEVRGHHGIWIDIFPIDKVPTNKLAKSRMFIFSAIRLLYTRNYSSNKTSGVINVISKLLLGLPKYIKKSIKNYSDKYVTKFCYRDKDYYYIEFTSFSALRRYYPSDLFTEYTRLNFEGYSFKIVKDYKKMLTILFGDYMKLPPEGDRVCKHNPEVISFNESEDN